MPVTVKLKELRRALDVTSYLIRNGQAKDEYQRASHHVHIRRSDKGLIVESTDRFAVILAHVAVEDPKTKVSDIYLAPRVITKMLSLLAEGYTETLRSEVGDLDVTISTDDERHHVTFTVEGLPVTVPNAEDVAYPKLGEIVGESSGEIMLAQPLHLNPRVLQCILRVQRHGEFARPLSFTQLKGRLGAMQPLRFQFEDWAVGCVMPMRQMDDVAAIDWIKS